MTFTIAFNFRHRFGWRFVITTVTLLLAISLSVVTIAQTGHEQSGEWANLDGRR